MPLTSVVAAAPMALFGPSYVAGTLPLVILSALLPPFTYLVTVELWGSRLNAIVAAVLAMFAGPLLILAPTTDNIAVFGAAGASAIYCATRAVRASRTGPWLVARRIRRSCDARPDRWGLLDIRRRCCMVRPPRMDAMAGADPGRRDVLWDRIGRGVHARPRAMDAAQPRGLRIDSPLGRWPYPLDHELQRTVLDRPRSAFRRTSTGAGRTSSVRSWRRGGSSLAELPCCSVERSSSSSSPGSGSFVGEPAGALLRLLRRHVLRHGSSVHFMRRWAPTITQHQPGCRGLLGFRSPP